MPDFNEAEIRKPPNSLIPAKTIVPVQLTIRPGKEGPGGLFKRSGNGDALMLDCEFTVIEGEYEKRKFWAYLTIEGETEGQKKAVNITRGYLRAMIESAKGFKPTDESQEAMTARRCEYEDLDGLRFWAGVGIEPGGRRPDGGEYEDKNKLSFVVTPDRKEWSQLTQIPRQAATLPLSAAPRAAVVPPPSQLGNPSTQAAQRPSWLK